MKFDFKAILAAVGTFFVNLGKKVWGGIVGFFKDNQMKKWIWLFIAGFFVYMGIEVLYTGLLGSMIGFKGMSYFSFGGHSSLWMGVVGGFLLIGLGAMNGIKWIKKQTLFVQSLLGAVLILAVEFAAGCILNLLFGLNVWDYSKIPLNVLGQINLLYGVFWFFLSPFAFWADDALRWVFYKTGICTENQALYNLVWFYKQLFTFKAIEYPVATGKAKKK